MGTAITSKAHRFPALTDALPLSPDGYTTAGELAGQLTIYAQAAPYNAPAGGLVDASTAINDALAAAGTAGGGVVDLGPGTFLISAGIAINASGVILRGAGRATILLEAAASTFDALTVTSLTGNSAHFNTYLVGCGVEHLAIRRATATTSTANALKLAYAMYTNIDDVYIYNFGTGLYCSAGLNTLINRVRVTGAQNNVSAMIGFHITGQLGQQSTVRLNQCAFQYDYPQATGMAGGNPNTGGTSTGYLFDRAGGSGVQDTMVTDCECDNASTGLKIDGGSGGGVSAFDLHFYNFAAGDGVGAANTIIITNCTGNSAIDFDGGIVDNGPGPAVSFSSGVTFRGMQLYNCGTGFSFSSGCLDCSVIGCNSTSGASATAFVSISASTYIIVANNMLEGSGVGVSFVSAAANCVVNGNTMHGITASNAVNIASGCGPITCNGNAWGGASNYTDTPGTNTFTGNI